ncbi:MAG: TonB-dependent receptor, partial [Acidobacteriota bacterium]|nr:TonB-dependent receptor [Acidobacteriota bacterium]
HAQVTKRVWTAWSAVYNSGLPVEDVGNLPPADFLAAQYGQRVVNSVNYGRGRVLPSFSLNASAGVDVWRHEQRSVTVQVDAVNLTNRLNVINFVGLLSGTAVGSPRAGSVRVRVEF